MKVHAWQCIAGAGQPELRPWDIDCLVFNPLSGHTHLLDSVSGQLLAALSAGPCATQQLARDVAQLLDLPCDTELVDRVDELLGQLDELGLIEPAAAC